MLTSIKTALTSMFAVLAVVTGLQGAVIYQQLLHAEADVDSVAAKQLPSLAAIRDIGAAVLRVRAKEFRLILSDLEAKVIAANVADLSRDEADLQAARDRYEALILSDDERQLYRRMSETLGTYLRLTNALPGLMQTGQVEQAQQLLLKPWLRVLFTSVDSQLQHAIALNERRAQAHSEASVAVLTHARTVGLSSAAVAAFLAISAVIISHLRIVKPLGAVTRALNQLAQGDTDADHVLSHRRDEIGAIGRAVEVFRSSLIRTRHAEAERVETRLFMENIAASTPDGIVAFDGAGMVTFCNPAAEDLLGLPSGAVIGTQVDRVLPSQQWLALPDANGHRATMETELQRPDGRAIPVELSYSRWEQGGHAMSCAILRDIRGRKRDEAVLHRLAHTDTLTELPNRLVLTSRMASALKQKRRFAVLLLDLDHFKQVNDIFGHQIGDGILQMAGRRLLGCAGPADTVTRIGGDEFIILLDGQADPLRVAAVADTIMRALDEPFQLEGRTIHLGASIGIALAPNHGSDPDELMGCADLALYAVKARGRHGQRLFTPDLRGAATRESTCRQELPRAVEQGEFTLFYQPQVNLSDGALVGAEALIRWRHPDLGLVGPDSFIHVLESSHLAEEVGNWVIRTACQQAVHWRRIWPTFRMGVNLSAAHFRSGHLARTVSQILTECDLPGSALEVEITERAVLHHDEQLIEPLRELQRMGVSIAFDDYGTGYASLSLLRRFPLNRLKIDRSFVHNMAASAADSAIVRTILMLARSLGLGVIAEGIETPEQSERLRQKGCLEGQGYFYSRPVPAREFEALFLSDIHPMRHSA